MDDSTDSDSTGECHRNILPSKSYDNKEWLHSRSARHVRIMCEYLEVESRLRREKVMCTILVFGSARCLSRKQWRNKRRKALSQMQSTSSPGDRERISEVLDNLDRIHWMCEYWEKIYQLSKKLMAWIQTLEARQAIAKLLEDLPSPVFVPGEGAPGQIWDFRDEKAPNPVALCTGGGPGMMEAANRGAFEVENSRSMGMGITIQFEDGLNKYIDKDLAFRFHYFFTRKFWMVYSAIALIVAPGGLGTIDELMEFLTLKQCKKFRRNIPVVLFGEKYWKNAINFDFLAESGVIKKSDVEQLYYTDSPDDAFEYIKNCVIEDRLVLGSSHIHKSKKLTSITQS